MKYLGVFISCFLFLSCSSSDSEGIIREVKVLTYKFDDKEPSIEDLYTYDFDGDVDRYRQRDLIHPTGLPLSVYLSKSKGSGLNAQTHLAYSANQNGSSFSKSRTVITDDLNLCLQTETETFGGERLKNELSYIEIDNKSYLSEIVEFDSDSNLETYRLKFDYSEFENNIIKVTQTFNVPQYKDGDKKEIEGYRKIDVFGALLTVKKLGQTVIPDVQLLDFYPLNAHRELLFSKYLGTFNYLITKIEMSGQEFYIQTSSMTFGQKGRPKSQRIERKMVDPDRFYLNYTYHLKFEYQVD